MKKLAVIFFLFIYSAISFAQEKPIAFVAGGHEFQGVIDGINIRSGLEFDNSPWRILAEYTHHIKRGKYITEVNTFDLGLTGQYVLNNTDKLELYALAGFSYFNGFISYEIPDNQRPDSNYNTYRLKLGAGAEYQLLPKFGVYSEFQFQAQRYIRALTLDTNLKAGLKYSFN